MRWAILASVIACASGLAIWIATIGHDRAISSVNWAYERATASGRQNENTWQERELAFLKSIHDRIQIELRHKSDGAASLQRENRLILEAMAEVTKTMSSDNLPADVKTLLRGSDLLPADAIGSLIETIVEKTSLGLSIESREDPGTKPSIDPAPEEAAAATVNEAPTEPPVVLAPTPSTLPPNVEPRAPPKLEETLHTEKTERGFRIRVTADALFGTERDKLDTADPTLSKVLGLIREMQPREIVVLGHTDASEKRDADVALSKDRARAVSDWLKASGVEQRQLAVRGYGGTRPIAPHENADGSDNPAGRAQNRRIEILLRRH